MLRPAEEGIALCLERAIGECFDALIAGRKLLHRAARRTACGGVRFEAEGERLPRICKDIGILPRPEGERPRRRERFFEREVRIGRRFGLHGAPLPAEGALSRNIVAVPAGVFFAHFHRVPSLVARRHDDAVLRHHVAFRQLPAVQQPRAEDKPLLLRRDALERFQKRRALLGIHRLLRGRAPRPVQRDGGILHELRIIGDARCGHDGGKFHLFPLAGAVQIPAEEHPAFLFGRFGRHDRLARLRRHRVDGRAPERFEADGHAVRAGGGTKERHKEHQRRREQGSGDRFEHLSQNSHTTPPSIQW